MQIPSFPIFLSICLSLYADSAHSSWNVEVELFFDVVEASKALVLLSIPSLHSEEFHLSLTPGQSRKSFIFQVKQVRSVLVCLMMTIRCPVMYPVFLISEVISQYDVFTSRVSVCGGPLDMESSLSMSWRWRSTGRVERLLLHSER